MKILLKAKNLLQKRNLNKMIKGGLKVGKNFSYQAGLVLDPSHYWLVEIGNNVTFARNVYILAHDASTKKHIGYTKVGKVKIGDNVFIGANSIILPGVTLGSNCIIGAGSVVTKDIAPNTIATGNPAKKLCDISNFIEEHKLNMKKSPIFEEKFSNRKKPNEKLKIEMNDKLENTGGYIV